MASTLISNKVTNGNNIDRSKKKKKKKSLQSRDHHQQQQQRQSQSQNQIRWKSETQQQIYSSKLIQALSQVRLSNGGPRGRAVREAADTALAVAAKGRSRWSRAILKNRLKLKFRKQQRKRQRVTAAAAASSSSSAVVTGNSRLKKPRVNVLRLKRKSLPAVQRKVRVLGRLVPGCRKQPLPVILDEATDYIAALEMQVRAMSALAQLFSGSSSGSAAAAASTSSAPPPPPSS